MTKPLATFLPDEDPATPTVSDDIRVAAVSTGDETGEAPSQTVDDYPASEAEANLGLREFYAEFATHAMQLDRGVSILHRPDAISLDYKESYTLGPTALGDFSAGPVDRPWRVRAVGNYVYAARQNNARTDFDPDFDLFSFAGIAPTEIDAAFDQAARILVCMERPTGVGGASEVWIYFFDPFVSGFVLTNFGPGRTPRTLLDDAVDSSNADVLVFYQRDGIGICYRVQRERYLTEHVIPNTIFSNIYLEDAYKSTSNRVQVLYSIHDIVKGTYSLGVLASVFYPFLMDIESWRLKTAIPLPGSILVKVLKYVLLPGQLDPLGNPPEGFSEIDNWKIASVVVSGTLISILITHTLYDVDTWKINTAIPLSGTVPVVLYLHTLYDVDTWKINTAIPIAGGTLIVVLIIHTLFDIDSFKISAVPIAGSTLV